MKFRWLSIVSGGIPLRTFELYRLTLFLFLSLCFVAVVEKMSSQFKLAYLSLIAMLLCYNDTISTVNPLEP